MEKEEENRLDPMKKWIVDAGTESLGADFHLSVLKKIEALPKVSSKYEPVISSLGWKLIFIFISVLFGGPLVFLPVNQEAPSIFDKVPPLRLPALNFSLYNFKIPTFDFSPPFLLGIVAFFILGFIMIVGTMRNKQAGI